MAIYNLYVFGEILHLPVLERDSGTERGRGRSFNEIYMQIVAQCSPIILLLPVQYFKIV